MNLKTWMLGFLGVQQAAAVYTTVSPQEAQSTVNLINSARRSVNPAAAAMPQVIWTLSSAPLITLRCMLIQPGGLTRTRPLLDITVKF